MKKKSKSIKKIELQAEPIITTIAEKSKTEGLKQPAEVQKPAEIKKTDDTGGKLKLLAVVMLFGVLLYLVYYFMTLQSLQFSPGPEIDQDSFKEVFSSAQNVYIVMDVRNSNNSTISNNILQCGVDFAASSGMGGKTVVPLSFSDDGCVIPTGYISLANCSTMLKDGITIYVKAGNDQARYYSNGMVVSVGSGYTLGACGIKLINLPIPVPQENSNSTETG